MKECDYMCVSYKVFGVNLHDEIIGDSTVAMNDVAVVKNDGVSRDESLGVPDHKSAHEIF